MFHMIERIAEPAISETFIQITVWIKTWNSSKIWRFTKIQLWWNWKSQKTQNTSDNKCTVTRIGPRY